MGAVINPDGRERLLDLIDQTGDGLRAVMEFDKIYSLADRDCQICGQARRERKPSVALVKIHHKAHPKGHLITLCEEHAAEWESRR